MKFLKSIFAAAVLALSFSSANAAVINDDSVIVSIVKDGLAGDSMLIDTQLFGGDFVTGAITAWQSNADLTTAIANFITGAASVEFWVAGRYIDGANKYALSTTVIPSAPAVNGMVDSNLPGYISNANIGQFTTATVGLTENWKADIPAGDPSHFDTANLLGSSLVTPVALAASGTFYGTQTGFFIGTNQFAYDSWNLAANGLLTYGGSVSAVPVPAAVWLFGSGLLGLVGVARRRKLTH